MPASLRVHWFSFSRPARAGSVKRVASAVGEGSVVISAVHSYLAGTKTS